MSMMREMPYLLANHYIVVAMRPVTFPANKADIIAKVGEVMIRNTPSGQVPFKEILEKMPLEHFSCAAEFYCALSAS